MLRARVFVSVYNCISIQFSFILFYFILHTHREDWIAYVHKCVCVYVFNFFCACAFSVLHFDFVICDSLLFPLFAVCCRCHSCVCFHRLRCRGWWRLWFVILRRAAAECVCICVSAIASSVRLCVCVYVSLNPFCALRSVLLCKWKWKWKIEANFLLCCRFSCCCCNCCSTEIVQIKRRSWMCGLDICCEWKLLCERYTTHTHSHSIVLIQHYHKPIPFSLSLISASLRSRSLLTGSAKKWRLSSLTRVVVAMFDCNNTKVTGSAGWTPNIHAYTRIHMYVLFGSSFLLLLFAMCSRALIFCSLSLSEALQIFASAFCEFCSLTHNLNGIIYTLPHSALRRSLRSFF